MTGRTVVDVVALGVLAATVVLWVSAYVLLRRARASVAQFAEAASKLTSVAAAVDTTDRPGMTPVRRAGLPRPPMTLVRPRHELDMVAEGGGDVRE